MNLHLICNTKTVENPFLTIFVMPFEVELCKKILFFESITLVDPLNRKHITVTVLRGPKDPEPTKILKQYEFYVNVLGPRKCL